MKLDLCSKALARIQKCLRVIKSQSGDAKAADQSKFLSYLRLLEIEAKICLGDTDVTENVKALRDDPAGTISMMRSIAALASKMGRQDLSAVALHECIHRYRAEGDITSAGFAQVVRHLALLVALPQNLRLYSDLLQFLSTVPNPSAYPKREAQWLVADAW